ncbi:spore coat protein CotY, partial [Bacillus wiedmannii]
MSCNCNEDHHHHDCDFNCVSNVVRFIHELQECATTTCGSGCEVPFLGAHNNASVANTRPFILYTKTGEPFEAFAPSSSLTSCRSPIFRVESIDDDDCAVLRVLTVVLGDGTSVPPG